MPTSILGYLRSSSLIRYMELYMPDLAWIVRIGGNFRPAWGLLRTGPILRFLRKFWH